MDFNPRVFRAYLDHFLPRDVVGPVIVVFSLEGVIDGLFTVYVPDAFETVGWGVVFLISILIVAYWGTADEQAVADLQEGIEAIQDEDSAQ